MSFLKLLTPTNIKQERERFFADQRYNPQFDYSWNGKNLAEWGQTDPKYADLADAVLSQDYGAMTTITSQLFHVEISAKLDDLAAAATENSPQINQKPSWDAVETEFTSAFALLGLHEYTLEISPVAGFNFRPSPTRKKITVSESANFDFFSLAGEVRHEVCHVVRSENAAATGIKHSVDYLPTEEGLAAFVQDHVGGRVESSLFQHASEYLVTKVFLAGSFRDGFDFLKTLGFSDDLAWSRAIRHKYGWVDTSQPGDCMKPAMYFVQEQKVQALSSDEKLRLFVGKISIEDLREYPRYTGRFTESSLQEFFHL